MKIYLAADHAGYELKEELKEYLAQLGHEVEDMGAHTHDPNDDYPDFIIPAGEKVAADPNSRGIVIGRFGHGEAIASNKVRGVRGALCLNEVMAQKAREHNDAHILALGADYQDTETAKKIVKTFLETPFSEEERHKRRIQKITDYEASKV